ncbi:MAG TPA: nucleotide-binding protein [Bacillales bacterium]|nr:nucleotide-binding protein [Bacillales bacterium]
MKNYVFYSWQSDLPNNTNRGFLEGCIEKALKELNMTDTYDIEFSIDKDTKDKKGTPHIAETIFSKIEKSKLFIADVSIINSDYEKRKTPNPNVLIELGYAVKVLGWNKIICIFNTDYGSFDDLPFDIKFRRPLCYSLNGKNKTEARKHIVEVIKSNISTFEIKELVSISEVGSYLIFDTSTFYNDLESKVKSIFQDKKLQENYSFTEGDFIVDIWDDLDYRIENDEPYEETDIQHTISVEFTDDSYTYNGETDRGCSIFITLIEKFKQINFDNKKVYSAFEILSRGYSPSNKGRDYSGLSDELMKRL